MIGPYLLIALPAARYAYMAIVVSENVMLTVCFLELIRAAVPPVRHGIQQHPARLRHIQRLGHGESCGVFHHSPCISRRQLDVVNDRVQGTVGVNLAKKVADQDLILAGFAELAALKGRRFPLLDDEPRNLGYRGGSARQDDSGYEGNPKRPPP